MGGWIVWGLACLFTFLLFLAFLDAVRTGKGPHVVVAELAQAIALAVVLVLTALSDFSKWHLLWIVPTIMVFLGIVVGGGIYRHALKKKIQAQIDENPEYYRQILQRTQEALSRRQAENSEEDDGQSLSGGPFSEE